MATRRPVAAAALLAVAIAGLLVVALQIQRQASVGAQTALVSMRMEAKAIRAARSLDNFWTNLDHRAENTAAEVREVQQRRFESGVGTRFESEQAERDMRTAADWGNDDADTRHALSIRADKAAPRR